ncbi:DUF418 domain-containing protein [Pseudoalteromonas sp. McH1-7]|uniref:DUF418 domain-containing protein n=1 Tax=Pseudoalteromonas sp. McH1-7 TaxID=2745574 RepID=UPI0034CFFEAA
MNNKMTTRINSLDFLRGIAILCILLINIESFAYPNPWGSYQYGFMTELDSKVRYWVYFVAQGKFYGLLAALFGVGLTMIIQKQPLGSAITLSASRLLVLFIIGCTHAYFIWSGDILYHYAVIGIVALMIILLGSAVIKFSIVVCISFILLFGYAKAERTNAQYQAYVVAQSVEKAQRSSKQHRSISRWENRVKQKLPRHSELEHQPTLQAHWLDNFSTPQVHKGKLFYSSIFWSTLMMMLIGSLLFQSGFFSAKKLSPLVVAAFIGLVVVSIYASQQRYFHWLLHPHIPILSYSKQMLVVLNRELQALVYIVVLSLLYNRFLCKLRWLTPINLVGRFALSNYILQSIVLVIIFYGFDLYNTYSRSELLVLWILMVLCQIVLNMIYGRFFTQGPLEKVWRTLTAKLRQFNDDARA